MNGDILANGEPVKMYSGEVSETKKCGFGDGAVAEASTPKSGKRKARDGQLSQTIKKKASSLQQKNAFLQLNELKPGLKYVVESEKGSSQNPQFEVFVHVNGQDFIGRGKSKQSAKLAAAEAALTTFDIPEAVNVINERNGFEEEILISSGAITVKADPIKIVNEAHRKNPVMLLNELHPCLTYDLVAVNCENLSQRYRISVEVNGKTYEGTGQRKKLAKTSAARAALSSLYKECYALYVKFLLAQSDDDDDEEEEEAEDDDDDLFVLPQELSHKMKSMQL